jgi:hypothetical protein
MADVRSALPKVAMAVGGLLLFAGGVGYAVDAPETARVAGPVTTTAAPTTTTTTIPIAPAVDRFYESFENAIRRGEIEYLLAHLHSAVRTRYGDAQCGDFLSGLAIPTYVVQVVAVEPPAPWQWIADGITIDVPNAFVVHLRRTAGADLVAEDEHLALEGDQIMWFADCGAPL